MKRDKLTPSDPEFYEGMPSRGISKAQRDKYNKAWETKGDKRKQLEIEKHKALGLKASQSEITKIRREAAKEASEEPK